MCTLWGHSRTPWVVTFHSSDSDLLASGSLDHEVRIWRISSSACIRSWDFGRPIASLSFHPSTDIIAVAAGHRVHMWRYASYASAVPEPVLRTRRSLRAVQFQPYGKPLLLTAEVADAASLSDSSGTSGSRTLLAPLSSAIASHGTSTASSQQDREGLRTYDDVIGSSVQATYAAARAAALAIVTGSRSHVDTPSESCQHPSIMLAEELTQHNEPSGSGAIGLAAAAAAASSAQPAPAEIAHDLVADDVDEPPAVLPTHHLQTGGASPQASIHCHSTTSLRETPRIPNSELKKQQQQVRDSVDGPLGEAPYRIAMDCLQRKNAISNSSFMDISNKRTAASTNTHTHQNVSRQNQGARTCGFAANTHTTAAATTTSPCIRASVPGQARKGSTEMKSADYNETHTWGRAHQARIMDSDEEEPGTSKSANFANSSGVTQPLERRSSVQPTQQLGDMTRTNVTVTTSAPPSAMCSNRTSGSDATLRQLLPDNIGADDDSLSCSGEQSSDDNESVQSQPAGMSYGMYNVSDSDTSTDGETRIDRQEMQGSEVGSQAANAQCNTVSALPISNANAPEWERRRREHVAASAAAAAATSAAVSSLRHQQQQLNHGSNGEQSSSVRLRLWQLNHSKPTSALDANGKRPLLTIPHGIVCSERGVHISSCGHFLAACVACTLQESQSQEPQQHQQQRQCVYEVRVYSLKPSNFGQVIAAAPVSAATSVTSVQISPTSQHVLIAYGRRSYPLLRAILASSQDVVPVYTSLEVLQLNTRMASLHRVRCIPTLRDELNVAVFRPIAACGIACGTKHGSVYILQHSSRALSSDPLYVALAVSRKSDKQLEDDNKSKRKPNGKGQMTNVVVAGHVGQRYECHLNEDERNQRLENALLQRGNLPC